MSARTATTWTCDRCDAEAETSVGSQPVGWARLYLAQPPQTDPNEVKTRTDLCMRCKDKVINFIERQANATVEARV